MKLYYSPFACSLAAHIACREAGLEVTLCRAELSSKLVEGQGDLWGVNPMGQVPTLVTDAGDTVMENSAVLMYIADHTRGAQLAPDQSSLARYELFRWLSFVGTELHKRCLAPMFGAGTPEAVKAHARESVQQPLAVVERHLATRESLLGAGFSVADAYLWWALTLLQYAKIPFEPYPSLRAYYARHALRPAVIAAVSFEREQRGRAFQASTSEAQAAP